MLRRGTDQRRTRPCLLYRIKRCIAPCVGFCTKEEYDASVDGASNSFKGKDKEVVARSLRRDGRCLRKPSNLKKRAGAAPNHPPNRTCDQTRQVVKINGDQKQRRFGIYPAKRRSDSRAALLP